MSLVNNSIVIQFFLFLWRGILQFWQGSCLKRLFDGLDALLVRWAHGSFLCSLFRRTGIFLQSWPQSLTCRFLTAMADLPPTFVRLVFRSTPDFAQGSLLCRILRPELSSTPISFLSWVFLLFLCVPHDLWNNTYGLILAAGGLALFWLGSLLSGWKLSLSSFGPWWTCFACSLLLSLVLSADRYTSLRYLCFHLTGLLLAVVLISAVQTEKDLMRTASFGTAGMAVCSLYGLYQSYIGVEADELLVDMRFNADSPGRVFSFFENPNTFGQILVMLIPLGIGLIFASRSRWGKLLSLLASALGIIALLLTLSRGSWLGLAAAAVVFVALYRRKLLPLMALCGLACIPLLPETILSRILSIFNFHDTSISSRFPIYKAGVKAIAHSPILGVGLGSEVVWAAFSKHDFYEGTFTFVHLHNVLLQLWVECGLFGALAFFGGSLSAFKESARAAARTDSPLKPLLIGGAAALAGALVCGITDYIWYYPRAICIFWFLMGILLAGSRMILRKES